ncbi:MAG: hypothetical protein AB4352_12150 [Hormoscilla sp.]
MTQAVVSATEVAIKEPQEHHDEQHLLTFQEYLFYEGDPDVFYELFRGKLIPKEIASPPIMRSHHPEIYRFQIFPMDFRDNLSLYNML